MVQGGSRDSEGQRNFNNRFFNNKNNESLLKDIEPKKPIGVLTKATGEVTVLKTAEEAGSVAATNVLDSYDVLLERLPRHGGSHFWKSMCSGLNSRIRGEFGKGNANDVDADEVEGYRFEPLGNFADVARIPSFQSSASGTIVLDDTG